MSNRKEEILKSNLLSLSDMNIKKNVGDRWAQFQCEDSTKAIVNAMEEYADERCIAFAEWIVNKNFLFDETNKWHIFSVKPASEDFTTQQLLEKFKQQNNKI